MLLTDLIGQPSQRIHVHVILILSDEKEKYDPIGFRDAILTGFEANNCSASDLEGVHKVTTI